MAERELHPLRQRQEQIWQLERDKEAMPRDYASLVPDDPTILTPPAATTHTGGTRPRLQSHRTVTR